MADVPLPNITRDMKHQKVPLERPKILQENLVRSNDLITRRELIEDLGFEECVIDSVINTHDGDWRFEGDNIWRFWMTPDVAAERGY